MADRWEYCALVLLRAERKGDKKLCELAIRYFGGESKMLSQFKGPLAREWDHDPWERAIAQLGEGGWELVSVQHANSAGDMGGGGEIDHANAIAYLKRPKIEGRAIDEPELDLVAEQ